MIAILEVKVYVKQIEQCSFGPGGLWSVNILQNPPIEEEENETHETHFGIDEHTQLRRIFKNGQIKFDELFIFRSRIEKDKCSALKFFVNFSRHHAHFDSYKFGHASVDLADFIGRGPVEHRALLHPCTKEPIATGCHNYFGGGIDNSLLSVKIEAEIVSGTLEKQRRVSLNLDKEFYLLYEKKDKQRNKKLCQNFREIGKRNKKLEDKSFFCSTRKDSQKIIDSILLEL